MNLVNRWMILLGILFHLILISYSYSHPFSLLFSNNLRYGQVSLLNAGIDDELPTNDKCISISKPLSSPEIMLMKRRQWIQFVLSTGTLTLVPKANAVETTGRVVVGEGAVGFEAAESAYAPMRSLYAVPLLPQSALLNSLPIDNILVGQLQAFLESYVQLIDPNGRQRNQIESNSSALWINLRINAQRAAGMFLYNQKQLLPFVSSAETNEMQELKGQLSATHRENLKNNLIRLVNVSRATDVNASLYYMRQALNELCRVAYLQVPLNRTLLLGKDSDFVPVGVDMSNTMRKTPRLLGRAEVIITVQRPIMNLNKPFPLPSVSIERNLIEQKFNMNQIRMVVDGLNFPLTAGNFIDLCIKEFYDNLPIITKSIEYSANEIANFTILGDYRDGYVDIITGKQRRIPLEIYRENSNLSRFTVTGAAKNSAVFTTAKPVVSFATFGSIGMMHDKGDRNGASSSFFWLPLDRRRSLLDLHNSPVVDRLDNKYALFAHVIEGCDLLSELATGDVIRSIRVVEGAWELVDDADDTYSATIV